jgi:hypothetical protein
VLTTLEQRHVELLALMATMRGLIAHDAINRDEVTRTRLGLSKASAARTRFLTDTVYPALLDTVAGVDAAQVRQLRADATYDRARSSAHVGKWNALNIPRDWQGFRRDAADILTMMQTRIDWEKRVLYPLLAKAR